MRLSSFQSGHNITTSGNILPTQIRTVGTGKEVESPVIDRRPATGYSQNVLLHVSICRRSSLGTGSHSFSRSSHRGSNNYCSSFTDIVRGIVHGIVYDSVHDIVGDIVIVTRILDSDQAVRRRRPRLFVLFQLWLSRSNGKWYRETRIHYEWTFKYHFPMSLVDSTVLISIAGISAERLDYPLRGSFIIPACYQFFPDSVGARFIRDTDGITGDKGPGTHNQAS